MANTRTVRCCLKPDPLDLNCDFRSECPPSSTVTLTLDDDVGVVMFERAEYAGTALTPLPSKTISFAIVAGQSNLDVVYAFSDPANGRATLKEACVAGTALMAVTADNPAVRYHVCG